MESVLNKSFHGNYFFKQLKKGDPSYFERLNDRFNAIKENADRLSKLTEEEMFSLFLKLMDVSLYMFYRSDSVNVSYRQ